MIVFATLIGFTVGSYSGSSASRSYSIEGANKSKELREAINVINNNLFEAALVPLAFERMQSPKMTMRGITLVLILQKSGRYDELMTAYNKILVIDPEYPNALKIRMSYI